MPFSNYDIRGGYYYRRETINVDGESMTIEGEYCCRGGAMTTEGNYYYREGTLRIKTTPVHGEQ